MAGDVDLKESILDEHDRGVVERFIAISNLSKEEVANQLQCITSSKAKKINERRKEKILSAIKQFGEAVIDSESSDNESFATYQARCKPLIDQLEKDLQPDTKNVMNMGLIFDPIILSDAIVWFKEKLGKFGGWWSNNSSVFWVNGIGKLQSRVSSRDAQVLILSISCLVESGILPVRTLKNFVFYNENSQLGREFYLGYATNSSVQNEFRAAFWSRWASDGEEVIMKLIAAKNDSVTKLMSDPNTSNNFRF
jgi:hypothetical protein